MKTFDLILADPLWGREPNQRKSDELSHIEMPRNKKCVLFFLAPATRMPETFFLMRCWDFKYKGILVFPHEPRKRTEGLMCSSEADFLYFGTKGDCRKLGVGRSFPSGVLINSSIHSTLESLFPSATKVELFGKEPREGWTPGWDNIKYPSYHVPQRALTLKED